MNKYDYRKAMVNDIKEWILMNGVLPQAKNEEWTKDEELAYLRMENEFLKKQLEEQKSSYKQLSSELGQSIFECEDLDKENRKLKKENEELKKEIKKLKTFKDKLNPQQDGKLNQFLNNIIKINYKIILNFFIG